MRKRLFVVLKVIIERKLNLRTTNLLFLLTDHGSADHLTFTGKWDQQGNKSNKLNPQETQLCSASQI